MITSVYLAGPDVFLPEALEIGETKKAMCQRHGLRGVFPTDKDLRDPSDPYEIYAGNMRLMCDADAGLINLTPFHGAGADAGTVFELGYLHALGKPVVAYTSDVRSLADRVAAVLGPLDRGPGRLRDRLGHDVEDFGLADNLMLEGSVREHGNPVIAAASTQGPPLAAIDAFDQALTALAQMIKR